MGLGLVEMGCIIVAGEDHVTGLLGDSIIGVVGHIIKDFMNSGICVFFGCGLLGAY